MQTPLFFLSQSSCGCARQIQKNAIHDPLLSPVPRYRQKTLLGARTNLLLPKPDGGTDNLSKLCCVVQRTRSIACACSLSPLFAPELMGTGTSAEHGWTHNLPSLLGDPSKRQASPAVYSEGVIPVNTNVKSPKGKIGANGKRWNQKEVESKKKKKRWNRKEVEAEVELKEEYLPVPSPHPLAFA
jgi:hypothetical protein